MALILEKELNTGIIGNYWKVTSFKFNILEGRCICKLSLYKDEDTRRNNKESITTEILRWQDKETLFGLSSSENITNPFILMYNKIKEPIYKDKIDEYGVVVEEQVNPFVDAVDKIESY